MRTMRKREVLSAWSAGGPMAAVLAAVLATLAAAATVAAARAQQGPAHGKRS